MKSQLGLAKQTNYDTFAAPSRFYEFTDEGLTPDVEYLRIKGNNDHFQRKSRRRTYIKGGSGDTAMAIMNKGAGLLLELMFGAVASAQVGTTAEWVHTFTIPQHRGRGLSATVQVGRESSDGTLHAFTHLGGKVTAWSLESTLDDVLKASLTWDFKTVRTTDALAVESLPADAEPFTFIDGTLTVDGATSNIKTFKVSGKNALDTDRRSHGAGNKREPLANGEYEIDGQLDMEFENLDAYTKWTSGGTAKLVMTYAFGQIGATGNPFKLVITLEAVEYTGEAPAVKGSELTMQGVPFKALYDGTNPIIKAVLHTSDTTP